MLSRMRDILRLTAGFGLLIVGCVLALPGVSRARNPPHSARSGALERSLCVGKERAGLDKEAGRSNQANSPTQSNQAARW